MARWMFWGTKTLVAFLLVCATCACAGGVIELQFDDSGKAMSKVVPPDFASFSMEWTHAREITSAPSFVKVLSHLHVPGKVGPNLRIGGNSADESWYDNVGNRSKGASCEASWSGKFCVKFAITAKDIAAVQAAATALNGSITFDLSFVQNKSTEWAAEEARAIANVTNGFARVEAIEIGNEPDLFVGNVRAPSYSVRQYEQEFSRYVQTLYPTSHCEGRVANISSLMSVRASDWQAYSVRDWVKTADSVNVPFLLGESNSVSCGGQDGLSNALAAALWAVDFMLGMAQSNVSRVNFHGGAGSTYSWLGPPKGDGSPDVMALFYGMFMFSKITKGDGVRIVPLKSSVEIHGKCADGILAEGFCCSAECGSCGGVGCGGRPGGAAMCCGSKILSSKKYCRNSTDVGCILREGDEPLVKAWGLRSSNGQERIVAIHKDYRSSATSTTFSIQSSSGNCSRKGSLYRLQLKSKESDFHARYGLEFAGQTWDGSLHGELVGNELVEDVPCDEDARYTFQLLPGSAALVTFATDVH
eukprot:g2527.t1